MKLLLLSLATLGLASAPVARGESAEAPKPLELTVDGALRTALIYAPPAASAGQTMPVVFIFHGHGGSSREAAQAFGIHRLWPQAVCVYPQGLDTPGQLVDPDGKWPGWQREVGDQGDRDLHFFDALLEKVKASYPVDAKRIYCTGHSNGGGFTYLLWLARPQVFAAFAPCSAAAKYIGQVTPKPVMILGGKNDPIVKFEWQERMMEVAKRINGCDADGAPWESAGTTKYSSKSGLPVVTFVYDGGHMMDPVEPGLIVKFFQEQAAK